MRSMTYRVFFWTIWGVFFLMVPCLRAQAQDPVVVVLPKEATLVEHTRRLHEAGVIKRPWSFLWRAFKGAPIMPGVYNLKQGLSPKVAFEKVSIPFSYKVRIPEGYTVYNVMRYLNQQSYLKGAVFSIPKEGSVLPATYEVSFEEDRHVMIEKMQLAMQQTLMKMWQKPSISRQEHRIQSIEQWVILASIVEKETGQKDERQKIAGVFLNRLQKGMRLQADPTTIYALTEGKRPLGRKLSRQDLKIQSPYNTYVIQGLPKGPIACPGKAALEAVLNPLFKDDLYFVADGEGGHRFAATLEEHHHNVRLWKQGQ